jgi:hypothetical protein
VYDGVNVRGAADGVYVRGAYDGEYARGDENDVAEYGRAALGVE